MRAPRITKEEFKRKIDSHAELTILDVRNPIDYAASNLKIPGSVRIPLDELEADIYKLDPAKEVVAYCT